MRTTSLALAATLALAPAAPAAGQQSPPPLAEPKAFHLPATRDFELPNGLQVTLVSHGEVPKAGVQLMLRSAHAEGADPAWLAEVMGDLMREGAGARGAEQIALEAARMGGAVNVTVTADQVGVGGDALAEFVPAMVALVADVARRPTFPAASLERVRADRLRQLALVRSQPQQLAQERFRRAVYGTHAYGRTLPTAETLQALTLDQLRDLHRRTFSAARARLYVVGRFDAAAVEAAVRATFTDWERGAGPAPVAPAPRAERVVHLIHRPGAVQSTLYLAIPVVGPSSPDYLPLQVTNALLGGSQASRITTNIRERRGYTYSPVSTLAPRFRDAHWAEIADVGTPVTGAALKEIFAEIDRLRAEPPAAEELRGVQNYLAGSFVLQNSSRTGITNQLAFVDLHGLGRDWLRRYTERVYAVTPEEVQRIARVHLDPARMTLVVVGDREKIAEQLAAFGEVRE